MQAWSHFWIGWTTSEADQFENDLGFLLLVRDEFLRAGAGAHFGDVAPAVEADFVQLFAAGHQNDRFIDGGRERQHSLLDSNSTPASANVVGSQLTIVDISQASVRVRPRVDCIF